MLKKTDRSIYFELVLLKPKTNYTKSGSFNIAYQVTGEGPIDIVYIPGWVSNIDMMWSEPRLAAFLTRLTFFSRLILFDKRGTGLSDRSDEYSTMEERMDDINAVMDADIYGGTTIMNSTGIPLNPLRHGEPEGNISSCFQNWKWLL